MLEIGVGSSLGPLTTAAMVLESWQTMQILWVCVFPFAWSPEGVDSIIGSPKSELTEASDLSSDLSSPVIITLKLHDMQIQIILYPRKLSHLIIISSPPVSQPHPTPIITFFSLNTKIFVFTSQIIPLFWPDHSEKSEPQIYWKEKIKHFHTLIIYLCCTTKYHSWFLISNYINPLLGTCWHESNSYCHW